MKIYQMASKINDNCFPVLKSVCVYWKIIGLCPFVLSKDTIGRVSYGGIIYTTTITLIYFVLYYRVLAERTHHFMTQEIPMTVVANFLGYTTDFFMVVSTWLYIILHRDQLQRMLKMFERLQDTSRIIDISQDFQRIFKIIKIHIIVLNITWIILFIFDHLLFYDIETFRLDIWVPFNVPRLVSHNVVVIFIDVLWIVKGFFRSLNDNVQNLSMEVTATLVITRGNRSTRKQKSRPDRLDTCGQMHSELVTLTKMIVEFFSLSILSALLVHLILMASDLYTLCMMTRDCMFFSLKQMIKFVGLFCWWLLHLSETIALIAMSDLTANEANRTGRVLHTMLAKVHTEKYDDRAQIVSLRLLQTYFNIDLYGLLQMRLSVVHKVIGMVVTYITIMMQIDIQNQRQQHV